MTWSTVGNSPDGKEGDIRDKLQQFVDLPTTTNEDGVQSPRRRSGRCLRQHRMDGFRAFPEGPLFINGVLHMAKKVALLDTKEPLFVHSFVAGNYNCMELVFYDGVEYTATGHLNVYF